MLYSGSGQHGRGESPSPAATPPGILGVYPQTARRAHGRWACRQCLRPRPKGNVVSFASFTEAGVASTFSSPGARRLSTEATTQ